MKWVVVLLSVIIVILFMFVVLLIGLFWYNAQFGISIQPQAVYVQPQSTYTSTVPVNVYSPPQQGNLYDGFDGKLNLNWSVLGIDTTHWSLTNYPGSLTITTQRGSFEYAGNDYKNVFLVDFPANQSQDFQLTTCIKNFQPSQVWNQAGLLLWNDKNNYLKFVYEYGHDTPNGDGLLFTVGTQISGSPSFDWFLTEQTPQTMWLRINKRGENYELYNSTDGKTFLPIKIFRGSSGNIFPLLPVPIKNIGVFTSNYTSTTAPEVDASFDFFEFKALPLLSNDPNEG